MDSDAMDSNFTDSNAIDSDDSSTFEPLGSFICDIRQGFGDMNNPRGFILKLEADEQEYDGACYVYAYIHHPNVGALLESAKSGCKACTLVCNDLGDRNKDIFNNIVSLYPPTEKSKHPEPVAHATQLSDDVPTATQFAERAKQKRAFTMERLMDYSNGRVVLVVRCDEESGPRESSSDFQHISVWALTTPLLRGYLRVFNSPYDPLDTKFEHRPSRDLLSSPHIGLIKRWRDTCKTEHKSCHKAAHSWSFPSRLLELLDSGERGTECGVRLIETHGTMREEFACLSYCWGNSKTQTQIGETTRANLSKQLQGVSFDGLPKTIIDAVYLCYNLGFRFLWVDRLCIIQDDARDWEKEASRMCDIYSRSALTITVPSCIRSSQSFFKKRQNARHFGEKDGFAMVECTNAESESKSNLWLLRDYIGRAQASWFLETSWSDFTNQSSPTENSWITRGWTFQEWMLSPRVLHIDTMTLWDCFEGYANELNRRYMEEARLLRNPEEYGKSLSWEFFVEEYTQRVITFEKDRLPALAGLASRYRQATGHTYLAGLWLEEMPRSLLWQRADNAPQNASEISTPSWSWASVTGVAIYIYEFSGGGRHTASFDSAVSICAWPDSPSLVSGHEKAWIDIKGHIIVVIGQEMQKIDNPGCLGYCYVVAGNEYWKSKTDHGLEYPEEEIIQSNIHLIVLGSVRIGSESTRRAYGALVLQKCGWDDDLPRFKRLGVAYLGDDERPVPELEYGPPWERQLVRLI